MDAETQVRFIPQVSRASDKKVIKSSDSTAKTDVRLTRQSRRTSHRESSAQEHDSAAQKSARVAMAPCPILPDGARVGWRSERLTLRLFRSAKFVNDKQGRFGIDAELTNQRVIDL